VPLKVSIDVGPVRVVKIEPSSVDILIDHLVSRTMSVQAELIGNPALGFQAGTPIVDPETVVLSGPKSLVDKVTKIVAPVNAEGLRSETTQNIPVVPVDSEGNTVGGVSADPATVSVTVPVQQLRGFRELVVTVPLVGTVKYGYRMTSLTTTPRVVTVYSDDTDIILAMPGYVETEPLDITGASADITRSLSLVLPEGVQVVGDSKVVVQVSISAIEDSITLSRPIRFKNLSPGLSAALSPSVVDVILSGPANVIWSLTPSDIDVFVDLQGLEEGVHKRDVHVAFVNPELEGVVKVILSPEQVEVSIQPATTPAP
jgi:YbbR domain-containing protein